METKPLLYGLIGFFIGGLLVSVAATTINKPVAQKPTSTVESMNTMTMDDMSTGLIDKTGDEFDKAFLSSMIAHHEGAVEMARLAETQAKHTEIKTLSQAIILAQESEIATMKQWQLDWAYLPESVNNDSHDAMNHGSMSH